LSYVFNLVLPYSHLCFCHSAETRCEISAYLVMYVIPAVPNFEWIDAKERHFKHQK
jgi:hypothetical protein